MTQADGQQETPTSAFTGEADELSLAQEQARQSADAEPDTLEVRGDGLSILQDQLGPWQRPLRLAMIVLAIGAVAFIAGSALRRRGAGSPSVEA
jgi:hypothetical protein